MQRISLIGMLTILTLFTSSFIAVGQKSFENDTTINTKNIKINNNKNTVNDSISTDYLVNNLYENWSTTNPYYKNSASVLFDSVKIVLQDTSAGQYYVEPIFGKITSGFGSRRRDFHTGVDIDLNTGDTIVASMDGIVRISSYERGGYGNLVIIRHENGLESFYGHLSKLLVDTGVFVKAGTPIALGGSTGRSTGSHLHYELRYLGKIINPSSFINFETGKPISDIAYLNENTDISKPFQIANSSQKTELSAGSYYIKKGDTLYSIGRKYGVPVNKICSDNDLSPNTTLRIGQKITLN